jgi:hypothetical protein
MKSVEAHQTVLHVDVSGDVTSLVVIPVIYRQKGPRYRHSREGGRLDYSISIYSLVYIFVIRSHLFRRRD